MDLREHMSHALFDACTGNPTGHYTLDLHDPQERAALMKLADLSSSEVAASKASGRGDTSQKGNWQNFRNEFMDAKPVSLSLAWFVALPRTGRIHFDYVSTRRPRKCNHALSEVQGRATQGRLKTKWFGGARSI